MSRSWVTDPESLRLLDRAHSPFDHPDYRRAWVQAYPGSSDVSFGARHEDGTRAAIALIREARGATSVPLGYGGVVATRDLSGREASAVLDASRRAAGTWEVVARTVAFPPAVSMIGRVVATTDVVDLRAGDPEANFAKKARQSIRRAERAGVRLAPSSHSAEAFLSLYAEAAAQRGVAYPAALFRSLGECGRARYYTGFVGDRAVSSLVVLHGAEHWMYWAAAQNEEGRRTEAGYLVAAGMLSDAWKGGAAWVNLGASASGGRDLGGVERFKRRLGGSQVPVLECRSSAWRAVAFRTAGRLPRLLHR